MMLAEFLKLEKEMLKKDSEGMRNKFLDGIMDGINPRPECGEVSCKSFIGVFNHVEQTNMHKMSHFDSNSFREVFHRETNIGVTADGREIEIRTIKNPMMRVKTFELYELIKHACVSFYVKKYLKEEDSIEFKIRYLYSQGEEFYFRERERKLKEHLRLKIGDKVVHRKGDPLRSGASSYRYAIVTSLNPFILKSEEGDMTWSSTVVEEDYMEWVPF